MKTDEEKIQNAIGHTLFGLLIMIPLGLVTTPLVGWLAQAMYWLGRERRDQENLWGINPHSEWYKFWNVFKWEEDPRRDLIAPVLINGWFAFIWTILLG